MPAERYFISIPFALEAIVHLKGEENHHLQRVMRTSAGTSVELVNGSGQLAHARVAALHRESAELHIETIESERTPPQTVILAQALPRMNRLEYIFEKGTELGVSAFWLFPAMLSEKETLSASAMQRLEHLMIAALKQCGRLTLPEIHFRSSLSDWAPLQSDLTPFFADTRPSAPKPLPRPSSPTLIFIGPEKGWHPTELPILEKTLRAQGLRLHDNILRVDTAAITALSILQALRIVSK